MTKYYDNEKLDSSFYYFNKAKSVAEIEKDTASIIHSLVWMAQIQSSLGDYSNSETTVIEAFPFIENTDKYPYGSWNIYNLLGNNYRYTLDLDNALYYYNKALNLKTDPIDKASIANNISIIYREKGEYQKSLKFLLPLIKKKEVLNDPITFSMVIDNLGYCYYKIGNPTALNFLIQSLKIRIKIKNDHGLLSNYVHLTEYFQKSNPTVANNYAFLAYKTATKLNSPDDRLYCLKLLIKNNSGNNSKKICPYLSKSQ